MSCADDRFTDEQLALYAAELTEPDDEWSDDPLNPHQWHRRKWWPVTTLPDISTYQPT